MFTPSITAASTLLPVAQCFESLAILLLTLLVFLIENFVGVGLDELPKSLPVNKTFPSLCLSVHYLQQEFRRMLHL